MTIYKKGYTHSGKFHADDVFSTALLKIVNPDFTVERVAKVPENADGIVYDIGGGVFDHHQIGSTVRENGIPYAAFGLLWREYGEYILGNSERAVRFDEKLVSTIDYADNTGKYDSLSHAVSSFIPPWNSNENIDMAFERAVEFAENILRQLIEREKAAYMADNEVMKAYNESNNNIVILKEYMPWQKILIDTDTLFVIYPTLRGGYNIQAVPVAHNSNELKKAFPSEWCGKEDKELLALSGIEGLIFCHKNGFLASAVTSEAARKTAEYAVNK